MPTADVNYGLTGNAAGAIVDLNETIKAFNVNAEKQTTQMLWLTKFIAGLTSVMLLAVLVQVWFAYKALPC